MSVTRMALIGMLVVALSAAAGADVIPISDVNENDANGFPVLRGEVVTVRGVVVVETGVLADTTDIYIQDATGGVNVIQLMMASPVVARGDSVEVTGRVDHATSSGRTAIKISSAYEGTRMIVMNSGNALPEPVELTPRQVILDGEDYEGRWAVVRDVSRGSGWSWGACGDDDRYTRIADADTFCWLWYDVDTDICGTDEPLETFEVFGVIVPDLRPVSREGHGILPTRRADILSVGPGSGFVELSPTWVHTLEAVDLFFEFEADGGVLNQVKVEIPDGWTFSGNPNDIEIGGPGFAGASEASTPDEVVLLGCALEVGSPGTIELRDVVAPDAAGAYEFVVMTGDDGNDPVTVQNPPEVGVGALAESGTILINELYAHSGGSDYIDRSEFIELYNPGDEAVDLTGWVLTDMSNSGECHGSNLWEFPPGTSLEPDAYLVVAKDARRQYGQGFYYVFGAWPDFELFDPYGDDLDWSDDDAPNMILVSPESSGSGLQEIRLIGGPDGNGTLVAKAPAYEAVFLYSDRSLDNLVDAVEYRNPVYLASDPCSGNPGLGGDSDAWTPGPPPWDTSLCRDDQSTDTDVSADDFFLAPPSPWEQNPAADTFAPAVEQISGAGLDLAIVKFSEPVDETSATDLGNYAFLVRDVTVEDVRLSRDGRTVLLETSDRLPGSTHSLTVDGVTDVAGNPIEAATGDVSAGQSATPISDVQAYDDNGICLMTGQTATVYGFTTVPPGVFQPDRTNMYIQDLNDWGVNVYSSGLIGLPPLEGDLISTTGEVVDYISSSTGAGATTEIEATSITVLARGFEPLPPADLPSGEVGHEDNEGRFVRTSGVVVSVEGFAIYINDGSGACQIYQNFNDLDFSVFAVGDSVEMTGVVLQYDQLPPFLSGYELSPRYESDMVTLTSHYSSSADVKVEARVLDLSADEAVEVKFNAPSGSHVTVRVYDLKGREIATLFDGLCLGPQRSTWDARDDDGRKVPIGVYLCHILARDRGPGNGTNAAVPIVVGTKLD